MDGKNCISCGHYFSTVASGVYVCSSCNRKEAELLELQREQASELKRQNQLIQVQIDESRMQFERQRYEMQAREAEAEAAESLRIAKENQVIMAKNGRKFPPIFHAAFDKFGASVFAKNYIKFELGCSALYTEKDVIGKLIREEFSKAMSSEDLEIISLQNDILKKSQKNLTSLIEKLDSKEAVLKKIDKSSAFGGDFGPLCGLSILIAMAYIYGFDWSDKSMVILKIIAALFLFIVSLLIGMALDSIFIFKPRSRKIKKFNQNLETKFDDLRKQLNSTFLNFLKDEERVGVKELDAIQNGFDSFSEVLDESLSKWVLDTRPLLRNQLTSELEKIAKIEIDVANFLSENLSENSERKNSKQKINSLEKSSFFSNKWLIPIGMVAISIGVASLYSFKSTVNIKVEQEVKQKKSSDLPQSSADINNLKVDPMKYEMDIEGRLKIEGEWGVIAYMNEQTGDFLPCFFKVSSSLGKKVLTVCSQGNSCKLEGVMVSFDEPNIEKDFGITERSGSFEIIEIKSVYAN
jgi:hypothetical protein